MLDEKKNLNQLNIDIIKIRKKTLSIKKLNEEYKKRKLLLLFLFLLIMIFLPQCSSKITITISGKGTQSILSDSFSNLPSKITINGDSKTQITKQYSMNLTENTIIMEWETPLKNCSNMFNSLANITKVDLSNFESSQVEDLSKMFYKCSNLKEVNLSGLNTLLVTDMNSMFYECRSLESLDFSSFNTLKVKFMQYMFFDCDSLLSLNLTSFQTPSLITTFFMFNDCDKLTYIDLPNFTTSNVNNMGSMFGWCVNLISVDLSNFDTSGVSNLGSMFSKCRKLLFVNLKSFVKKTDAETGNMFEEVPNDLIYCIGEKENDITTQLKAISNNNDCSNICFSKSIIVDIDQRKCICSNYLYNNTCYEKCPIRTQVSSINEHLCEDLNCTNYYDYNQSKCINIIPDGFFLNDTKYKTIDKCHPYCKTCEEKENEDNTNCKTCISNKYFDSGNCTSSCINGYYIDSLNNSVCKCKYDVKCESCSTESIKYNLCITCNNNYFPKYNDSSNKLGFINCYNNLDGYFLDNNIYKSCYSTCKKCNISGDENENNCTECIDNYIFINNNENNVNCYKKCEHYYYFDSSNKYYCTEDDKCPNEYQKLIKEKGKCIKKCNMDNDYQYEFNNTCYANCPAGTNNSSENPFLCEEIEECSKYLYNNTCYEKCPIRTQISPINEYLCEDLNCANYYDYNQSKCINIIPDGFFLNDTKYKTIDKCHPYCKTCEEKENEDNTNCKTCISNKYFDSGNCTSSCINGYYIDSLNNSVCKCKYDVKCESCSTESIKYNLCITCNNNYFPKYNDSSNKLGFINCYNNLDGYFLDNNIYKSCYSTCKKCNISGDENENNCTECIDNYIFINNNENNVNCYKKCEHYYYFDSSNKYYCTEDDKCPNEYQKLIKEKGKCIKKCNMDNDYQYEFNNTCYANCPAGTNISSDNSFLCETIDLSNNVSNDVTEEFKLEEFFNGEYMENNKTFSEDFIISNIQKEILNGNIKLLLLNKSNGESEDLIIKEKNILYHITTSSNQNNNKYENVSNIKLGKCENSLRTIYNISNSTPLLIFIIEANAEGYYIPIIEYEVYDSEQNKPLNLNYCNNSEILLSIPVTINENNLFKHNSSSEYYNDECNTYTTESGTDIILKDRRKEYTDNNMALCESNCKYNGYNATTKKVDCQCKSKNMLTLFSKINIDQDRLLNNFLDLRTSANIGILKCYKNLFSEEGLKNNIGSYCILSIILIYIVSLFFFIFKGFNLLNNRIKSIISYGKRKRKRKNNRKNNTKKKVSINNPNKKKQTKKQEKKKKKRTKYRNINMAILKTSNDGSKSHSIGFLSNSKKNLCDLNFNEKIRNTSSRNNNNNNSNIKSINQLVRKYNDYEINTLIYSKALLLDKRTYIEYYFSLLRIKHLIIFTFYTQNDYNSIIIKICLLFFSFALYYTVNALFFSDSTMHKIYEDEGMFDIVYQLPQILYSSLISSSINNILKYLSLSEKNIIEIKKEKINLKQKIRNTLKCLKLKFVFFFSLSFFFLTIFWYYLASFCAVYKNTQIHLIKDVLISFALTLVYPLGLCLIPGILRIPSLRDPKKEREYMYKISIIIQNLI